MVDIKVPRLGVGMVFSAALWPFLKQRPAALDLLEIEPQTQWLADHPFKGPFFEFTPGIDAVAKLPGHKLVHSVGVPLGGTRAPDRAQMALLAQTAAKLDSPWVSEHLSVAGTPHHAAGFLLPPLQTDEGVETAARNIRLFAQGVCRPVAVETGVAYFKRKSFEMNDGAFVASVAEEADCGILLDLHNLYCNQKNGRIKIEEFLEHIPLDRVWEIHLAGGVEREGYWLDSHSGPMPPELFDLAIAIVKKLPNLGAVNFEIYDTFLQTLDLDTFDQIVEDMRAVWAVAGTDTDRSNTIRQSISLPPPQANITEWEHTTTEAVWKGDSSLHPWAADQKPLKLYAWLARSFRGSMLTRGLPRAMRYLLLRDREDVDSLLAKYYAQVAPQLYTPLEAHSFSDWLRAMGQEDPLLISLLDYDLAFIDIIRYGEARVVTFPGNPASVFEDLANARLPNMPPPPTWDIELLPDSYTIKDFTGNVGLS